MRRTLSAAALVALAGALAACGNATIPVTPASKPPVAPATSAGGTAAGAGTASSAPSEPCGAATVQLKYCPPGFQLPSDLALEVLVQSPEETNLVAAPEPTKAAMQHFRSMLTNAGYTIDTDAGGLIAWSGKGWTGNVIDGGVITWWVEDKAPQPSSSPVSGWLTARDLGISKAPFFLRYPAGSSAVNLVEDAKSASYELNGASPADMISFYTEFLTHVHFDVTVRDIKGDNATIEFTTEDYTSTFSCTAKGCSMKHTAR